MAQSACIELAGLRIGIHSPKAWRLGEPDAAYREFACPLEASSPRGADIDLLMEQDAPPDVSSLERVYESGEAWTLLRASDEYVVALGPGGGLTAPVCVVRFRPEGRSVRLRYAPHLMRLIDGNPALPHPLGFPLDRVLMMSLLSARQGALIHGALLLYGKNGGGDGYLFVGLSGAGKTTLSRLMSGHAAFTLINDERAAIRREGTGLAAYGTPWPGEAGVARNARAPLRGVYFLTKGTANSLRPLGPGEALRRLLPAATVPWYDREMMTPVLCLLEALIAETPAMELTFTPDARAAEFIEGHARR